MTPATPLISSVRIIPIYPSWTRPPTHPPIAWRVWVEWWGIRQAMGLDCRDASEAQEWVALVEAVQPSQGELREMGWGYGGVASHEGAPRPTATPEATP